MSKWAILKAILSWYGELRVRKNPHSRIFYAVLLRGNMGQLEPVFSLILSSFWYYSFEKHVKLLNYKNNVLRDCHLQFFKIFIKGQTLCKALLQRSTDDYSSPTSYWINICSKTIIKTIEQRPWRLFQCIYFWIWACISLSA